MGACADGCLTLDWGLDATRRNRAPEPLADRVERTGSGSTNVTMLSSEERDREALLMGLRLTEGINEARFAERTGRPMEDCVDPFMLEACLEENYLTRDGGILKATGEGRLRLEALLARLVT